MLRAGDRPAPGRGQGREGAPGWGRGGTRGWAGKEEPGLAARQGKKSLGSQPGRERRARARSPAGTHRARLRVWRLPQPLQGPPGRPGPKLSPPPRRHRDRLEGVHAGGGGVRQWHPGLRGAEGRHRAPGVSDSDTQLPVTGGARRGPAPAPHCPVPTVTLPVSSTSSWGSTTPRAAAPTSAWHSTCSPASTSSTCCSCFASTAGPARYPRPAPPLPC